MIGKSIIGRSFSKLLKYILRSNALLNENTVQLLHMHRLENAAEEMADIATLAPGIQTPAWHLIMAWRFNEFPSGVERSHVQNRMHEAAHSLLRKLGLEDHQAIIVPHWDRKGGLIPGERHYEVHIAANRVSLDGVAVRSSFDFVRVERAVAEISAEMGFFLVPGRFNGVAPDLQNPKIAHPREARFALSPAAKRVQDRSGELTIVEEIHDDPARFARLRHARNAGWEALVAELASQGYRLEYGAYQRRPGQAPGLVVVDIAKPARRMAFSKLDTPHLKWGQGALERELGAISEGLVRQPGGAVADTPDAQPEPEQQPAKAPPRHRMDGHIWERFRQQQAGHKAGNRAARRKLVIADRSAYRNFDAH